MQRGLRPRGKGSERYYTKEYEQWWELGTCARLFFDLDGTLIDSKLDIGNSVNAMLRETRREEMSIETVAAYIGHGPTRTDCQRPWGGVHGERARCCPEQSSSEHYEKHNMDATRAYPGVENALALLKEIPWRY